MLQLVGAVRGHETVSGSHDLTRAATKSTHYTHTVVCYGGQ